MDESIEILRSLEAVLRTNVRLVDCRDGVTVEVEAGQHPVRLRAAWLPRGWPADVRQALEHHPRDDVLVAPAFSIGARRILNEHGVNWVDRLGGASLRGDGLIVSVPGQPPPADPVATTVRWSKTAIIAGEAVLSERPERLTVAALAQWAGCSPPRATQILQSWDRQGWTAKKGAPRGRGAHRVLESPDALLDSWAEAVASTRRVRWYAHSIERDIGVLRQRLDAAVSDLQTGWTGWVGSDLLAPFASQTPILHLRVSEQHSRSSVATALEQAGVRLTEEAGRIELWLTDPRAFAFVERFEKSTACSWPRVYADLSSLGGRGHDVAEHLRDVMGQSE